MRGSLLSFVCEDLPALVTVQIQLSCKPLQLRYKEAPLREASGVPLLNHSTTQIQTGPNDHHGKAIGFQIPLDFAKFPLWLIYPKSWKPKGTGTHLEGAGPRGALSWGPFPGPWVSYPGSSEHTSRAQHGCFSAAGAWASSWQSCFHFSHTPPDGK